MSHGSPQSIVPESNSENCLNVIFVASPCEKVIFVSDEEYVTSAIRNFMLDMVASKIWAFKSDPDKTQTM